jgi:antitoxin ParD1/3/4
MKRWVETRAASGEFGNASDYLYDLVRRDQDRIKALARLQAEIDKGRASGISDKSLDEIMVEARKRGRAALKAHDAT